MRLRLMRPTRAGLAAAWQWMRALAAGFFAIALAMLAMAFGPTSPVLGWALVALGGAYALGALAPLGAQARGLLAAVGAAYAVCGSLLIVDPLAGTVLLFGAIAFAFLAGGLVQVIAALARPHAQLPWAVAGGLAVVGLGAMVALRWPLTALPALCVALAIAAAAQGAACRRLAAVGQRLARRHRAGHARNPSAASSARAVWWLPFGRQPT